MADEISHEPALPKWGRHETVGGAGARGALDGEGDDDAATGASGSVRTGAERAVPLRPLGLIRQLVVDGLKEAGVPE